MKTAEERFWAKVNKTDNCWEWTAYRSPKGYGQLGFVGRVMAAHRYSYELHVGPIPEGIQVDHVCFNRACVRPDHLRLTTPKQNQENRSGARKDSGSGVRGVTFTQGKFMGHIRHERRFIYVGRFNTLLEAEAAVTAKRLELFTHNDIDRKEAA